MTNLNNNELSARTNLHNFCNTVKAGLHSAVVSPRKRHALLVLLLLGADEDHFPLVTQAPGLLTDSDRSWLQAIGPYACTGGIYLFVLGCR